jgi:periplasmic divalent cation tolerance protein
MNAILILTTVADSSEADRLARSLVESRLAACVNRIGPMRSTYRWNGATEVAQEYLLLIKTLAEHYPAIERHIRDHHAYSTPEIISLTLRDLEPNYRRWLESSVSPGIVP